MTDYTLDQLNEDAAAAVDRYIAATTAAQKQFGSDIDTLVKAVEDAGLDDDAAGGILAAHLKRMEKAIEALQ